MKDMNKKSKDFLKCTCFHVQLAVVLHRLTAELAPDSASMSVVRDGALRRPQFVVKLLARRQHSEVHLSPVSHEVVWEDSFPQKQIHPLGRLIRKAVMQMNAKCINMMYKYDADV